MKASVVQSVSLRSVEQGQELDSLNNEVRPILRSVRDVACQESQFKATTTTDAAGTYKRIWESDIGPPVGSWFLQADVVATGALGAAAAAYMLRALVGFTAASITLVSQAADFTAETAAAMDARFGVDTATRVTYVEVRDDANFALKFTAVVRVLEGT